MTINTINKTFNSVQFNEQIITPYKANQMLENNNNNRRVSNANVTFLAHQMSNGLWQFNGETIKICKNGDLVDGQHRLLAVIQSNTNQRFVLVTGLEWDSFSTIDTGRKRTAADTLGLTNIKNSAITASLCRYILIFNKLDYFAGDRRYKPSNIEILMMAEGSQSFEISEAVKKASTEKGCFKLATPTALALCFYYFNKINPIACEDYMDKLVNGYGQKDDPALAMQKLLIKNKTEKSSFRSEDIFKYALKSFEDFLLLRKTKRVILKKDSSLHFKSIRNLR
jgi:hypothetical protein